MSIILLVFLLNVLLLSGNELIIKDPMESLNSGWSNDGLSRVVAVSGSNGDDCPNANNGDRRCIFIASFVTIQRTFKTDSHTSVTLNFDFVVNNQVGCATAGQDSRCDSFFAFYSCGSHLYHIQIFGPLANDDNLVGVYGFPVSSECDGKDITLYFHANTNGDNSERGYIDNVELFGTQNSAGTGQSQYTQIFYRELNTINAVSSTGTVGIRGDNRYCIPNKCIEMFPGSIVNINGIDLTGYYDIRIYWDLNLAPTRQMATNDYFRVEYRCNNRDTWFIAKNYDGAGGADVSLFYVGESAVLNPNCLSSVDLRFTLVAGYIQRKAYLNNIYVFGKATVSPTITPIETIGDPTIAPTLKPTDVPSKKTDFPTKTPTETPSMKPSISPAENPTATPTNIPTETPIKMPTLTPTKTPTTSPTNDPTTAPTEDPTTSPTVTPSNIPTKTPTNTPTSNPTTNPTTNPTMNPSVFRTMIPSLSPSISPVNTTNISPVISVSDGNGAGLTKKKNQGGLYAAIIIILLVLIILVGLIAVYVKKQYGKRKDADVAVIKISANNDNTVNIGKSTAPSLFDNYNGNTVQSTSNIGQISPNSGEILFNNRLNSNSNDFPLPTQYTSSFDTNNIQYKNTNINTYNNGYNNHNKMTHEIEIDATNNENLEGGFDDDNESKSGDEVVNNFGVTQGGPINNNNSDNYNNNNTYNSNNNNYDNNTFNDDNDAVIQMSTINATKGGPDINDIDLDEDEDY